MDSAFLKQHAYSIAAMRKIAQRRLPKSVFDFVDGGAEDEIVVGRNESAFDALSLLPQPMRGTTRRDQTIKLFGNALRGPVLIGPTGMTGMLWPRGEIEAARAAAAAGTVYTMSHGATVKMEDLAREAPGHLWMQVFSYKDRGLTQSFAERAHAAGFQEIGRAHV